MPNPKRKHSHSRTNKRRGSTRFVATDLSKCTQCGVLKLPHRVCAACGYYKGTLAVPSKAKKGAKSAKK
ncbi:MAG: 50S ribosomal protein L32 [Candidatus Ratteibacteria bacterium]|jgi:large subunit ribosomal protein L32